jgi:hypothetical protein
METYIVLGLNQTGRALAFMLSAAANEKTKIILVDEDIVSKESIEDGFPKFELGAYKAEAMQDVLESEFPLVTAKAITKPSGTELYEELQDLAFGSTMFCCKYVTAKTQAHIFKTFRPLCSEIMIAMHPNEQGTGQWWVLTSSSHYGDFVDGGQKERAGTAPLLALEMFVKAKHQCNQP